MSDLPGHSIPTARQVTVDQDAGADAFGHRHHHQIAANLATGEPGVRQRTGVCRVIEFHFEAGGGGAFGDF